MVNKIFFFTVILTTFLSAQIIDRANVLRSKQIKQLDQICSAVFKNSGEQISIVIMGNDDIYQLEKLNNDYAQKLHTTNHKEWVLASISPDGSVQFSMSKGDNETIIPDHTVTLSEGTMSIYHSGEQGRAVEFLLLNICDIIAQKRNMELGTLLVGSELAREKSRSNSMVLLFILVGGTIFAYRRFIRNEQITQVVSSDFGGSLSEGTSDLFKITSQ